MLIAGQNFNHFHLYYYGGIQPTHQEWKKKNGRIRNPKLLCMVEEIDSRKLRTKLHCIFELPIATKGWEVEHPLNY